MSEADPQSGELDPGERWADERLRRDRPVPSAAFRGALSRRLVQRDPGYGPRPQRLWTMVAAYALVGVLLILLGLLQATGAL